MRANLRFSDPVDCGERTIVPIIRDMTRVSDHWGMVARDPVGLVIMENKQAWFISLSDGVSLDVIDELLGTGEEQP
jgi:hypothetical protein